MPNPHPTPRPSLPPVLPAGVRIRPNGSFERRYRDANGARKSVYGRTLEDVLEVAVERIPLKSDRRLTVATYLEDWSLPERLETELRPNSAATHRTNVVRHLVPAFGTRTTLHELGTAAGPQLVDDAFRRIRNGSRELSPRTLGSIHATLRRALNDATPSRIPTNPALRYNPTGRKGREARARRVGVELAIPTRGEVRALEETTRGTELHALVVAAAVTGLRQSELLGLSWDDVDLEARRLTVRKSLRKYDGVLDDPKTPSSARTIRFPAVLVDELRMVRDAQRFAERRAGDRWDNPAGLIFTTGTGHYLDASKVSRSFGAACRSAGIPGYRFHDLRHHYATGLLEAGVDLSIVSKSLGHSSVTVTADIYGHLTDRMRDDVADVAAGFLR